MIVTQSQFGGEEYPTTVEKGRLTGLVTSWVRKVLSKTRS
jgi:hypothetical protein